MKYLIIGFGCLVIGSTIGTIVTACCVVAGTTDREMEKFTKNCKNTPLIKQLLGDVEYICPVCGQEYIQSKEYLSKYCPNCGTRFNWDDELIEESTETI